MYRPDSSLSTYGRRVKELREPLDSNKALKLVEFLEYLGDCDPRLGGILLQSAESQIIPCLDKQIYQNKHKILL
jgi:hypothetical protein